MRFASIFILICLAVIWQKYKDLDRSKQTEYQRAYEIHNNGYNLFRNCCIAILILCILVWIPV